MSELIGFVITAGHLDIEWYQPLSSYRFWTVESIRDLKTAAKRDDFATYVLDGQVFPLEVYLSAIPEDLEKMKELVKNGKLSVGPFYTQFDEWLPSAESIIRNCLYGRRRAEAFGKVMNAGYLPDNFGHPLQIPQILNGFGIDSLLFMRGLPEIAGGHPDEFMYAGIDGSKVLVSHFRNSYGGAFDLFSKRLDPIQPRPMPYYADYLSFEWHREAADHDDPKRIAKSMINNVYHIKDRYPSKVIPLVAGYDHMPPQINVGETITEANNAQDDIKFVMGSVEDYIRLVQSRIENPECYKMELLGSRYQYVLLGALSTRNYLKREQFTGEVMLERYAEPLDLIAKQLGYDDMPRIMDEAWEKLMINSAHDSIHGSSMDEVHIEMQARYAISRQIASGLVHSALAHIGKNIRHWWKASDDEYKNTGFITYVPSHGIEQPCELWLPVWDKKISILTKDGRKLPAQVLDRVKPELNGLDQQRNSMSPHDMYRKVLFLDKFSSGIDSYTVCEPENEPPLMNAGDNFIENEFIRIDVKGALINLTDKITGKKYYNLNLLEEEADAGDVWDFSEPWLPGEVVKSTQSEFLPKLVEHGCNRSVIEISGEMLIPLKLEGDKRFGRVSMPVTFVILLYRNTARTDIKLILENTAEDHRIRLKLMPLLKTDFIRSQGHLAVIDRPVRRPEVVEEWFQPQTNLLPFREWVSVQDKENGLAIGIKGIYDYEAFENKLTGCPEIALTLLRGVGNMSRMNMMQRKHLAAWSFETPGSQCKGKHEIEFSYIPFRTNIDNKTPFLPVLHSWLYPPVAHAVRSKPIAEASGLDKGIEWNAENIIFSTYKQTFDKDGAILRLYENQGKATTTEVYIGMKYKKAWLADMNEQPQSELKISEGYINLSFDPYKALTIKLI